jgi:hypothetical protein
MKKTQAYYELFEKVRSRKRITDTFLKTYWPYKLEASKERTLLSEVLLVGRKSDSLAMLLKWLVQLHIIVVTRCEEVEFLSSQLVEFVLPSRLQFKSSSSKDKGLYDLMSNRVGLPYLQYIQRRCLKSELVKRNPSPQETEEGLLTKAFELLNLINSGCSFCRELYKFARYYSEEYPFMTDLNVILGMDLRESYNSMHVIVYKLWQRWNTLSGEFQTWLNSLVEEINKLNELMFVVFYNTYNYSELRAYLPNWIRLEPKETLYESPRKKMRSLSQDEGRVSTAVSFEKSPRKDLKAELSFSFNLESVMNMTMVPTRAQYNTTELDMIDASEFHLDQSDQPLNV